MENLGPFLCRLPHREVAGFPRGPSCGPGPPRHSRAHSPGRSPARAGRRARCLLRAARSCRRSARRAGAGDRRCAGLGRRQLASLGRRPVWTYPGASSLGSDSRRGLQEHPTVKPTALLQDAILDFTRRGDIVIDPFLGSGSTLIATEKTGRVSRGAEVDPLYVDVIIRRYQAATLNSAVLVETGETLEELGTRRASEGR